MSAPGAGEGPRAALSVLIEGVLAPEDTAREIWARFSAHMEEHKGDLAGFAASEGFASAHPRPEGGRAVLVLSRSARQEAYGAVTAVAPSRSSQGPSRPRRRR